MSNNLDRYQIIREWGRGGMAAVYLAHDPRFDRQVALKVLPRQFLHDQTFLERFSREARTIARLEHTAIVPVYDFGEHEGQPFLVMRFMAGGSLTERLQRGALPLPQVIEVLRRLGDALDYAHSRGVIHRDLKPGNILFDDRDNAFLADFGIAKLAEATATLTGAAIIGTPAYMSPEQAQGNLQLDGRSDIYALGVILFQMLTGRLPFTADTPARQLVAHILSPIPQISAFRPDLPLSCDSVIAQAMAKNRDERFGTASQMAEVMAQKLAAQQITKEKDIETAVAPSTPPAPLEPTEIVSEPERPSASGAAHSGEATVVDTGKLPPPPPGVHPMETVVGDEPFIIEPEPEPVTDFSPLTPASMVSPVLPSRQVSAEPAQVRKVAGWVWAVAALALVALVAGAALLRDRGWWGPAAPVASVGSGPEGVTLKNFIEENWTANYDATNLAYGGGLWAVVMSDNVAFGQQTWYTSSEFPKTFIEERWETGYRVTDLGYGDGRWVVMMTRRSDWGQQSWYTSSEFPRDFIQERWQAGYKVTGLAYGAGRWAVVMARDTGWGQQIWYTNSEFPKAFIAEKWAAGYKVTSLTYGNGRWAVMMTRAADLGQQTWYTRQEFPKAFIQEKWEAGYDVTGLAYGDGRWAVVMTRESKTVRQIWQTAHKFN